jgi:stage V sporulation protein R
MNEGCATFVHYYILNKLYDQGRISEGAMLEILNSHSSVVMQPAYDDPRYGGLNPYALGFEMMCDIKRICTEPTDEDREWFPDLAGSGDWRAALRYAWANYRDESFILQYLSPHLMRKFRMFLIADEEGESTYSVKGIHDEAGYRKVRAALAQSYEIGRIDPDIQVVDADLKGDRCLTLRHMALDRIPLETKDRDQALKHLRRLWGYDVSIESIDRDSGAMLSEARITADRLETSIR